jgi:2-dehydro-3-deoxygluconokinase
MSSSFDVVTFGESMVLYAPSERGTLESAPAFHASIGGAESNCAIGLARLGYSVGWVSRLGDDPFGARVLKTIRGEGVDVSRSRCATQRRLASCLRRQDLVIRHAFSTIAANRRDGAAIRTICFSQRQISS